MTGMAVRPDQMVTVDGVRYEPDDAPKHQQSEKKSEPDAKKRTPANKSRTPRDK